MIDVPAARTVEAYQADWSAFESWCSSAGVVALPALPSSVALYLAARAGQGLKVATLMRSLWAISQAHKAAGHQSPGGTNPVRWVIRGVRRANGVAQNQKDPLRGEDLRLTLEQLPGGLLGTRDRALLLVGISGAFRRSELVGLVVEDLAFTADVLTIHTVRKVVVSCAANPELCPVRALRAWLKAAAITAGPVFREVNRHGKPGTAALSGRSVARIVKRAAGAAGLDASKFAGHSLRQAV